jgi:hypothetical protein
MAAGHTSSGTVGKDTQDSTARVRYLVTVTIAVVLLLAFGLLVYYLNGKADGENELAWQRRIYLFGGVEAIVFTAVGWIFGREVNRQQVDAAENRANASDQKADAAANKAAVADAKVADLGARGEAAKAAVQARHAVLSNPQGVRTRSVYGDKAGAAATELEDLVKFMSILYPD